MMPDQSWAARREECARDVLLGQHGCAYIAELLRLPKESVQAMAEARHRAGRIRQVRP